MATWRVFKDVTPPRHGELPDGEIAAWAEHEPIESEYDYDVRTEKLAEIAGEGTYLLIRADHEWSRPLSIEVRKRVVYERVLPEPAEEPGFSVAVTDEPE